MYGCTQEGRKEDKDAYIDATLRVEGGGRMLIRACPVSVRETTSFYLLSKLTYTLETGIAKLSSLGKLQERSVNYSPIRKHVQMNSTKPLVWC